MKLFSNLELCNCKFTLGRVQKSILNPGEEIPSFNTGLGSLAEMYST